MALWITLAAAGCSESGERVTVTTNQGLAADGSAPEVIVGSEESEVAAGTTVSEVSDYFSERDLVQTADLANAASIELESGQDVRITEEGVYVLGGDVSNVTVVVEAADDAKVQLVLDGVAITNVDAPAIYVKAADKVFVTTTDSSSSMEVTGSYTADGEGNLDAVIFSRADLTLNGTGSLAIIAPTGNGIASKDDLRITGGEYTIEAAADGLEANDAIKIHDGILTIQSGKDALHSENEEDASLGYVYMEGGTLQISAVDDAIRANSYVRIDGGTINIEMSQEGIEANYITINDGQITLYAKDDGINASAKVDAPVGIEVNGGTIHVEVGSGDTDAFDSNGNLYINGGIITVEASSAFDFDGEGGLNGGNVTVNGATITELTASRGGGMGMGMGGRR